MNVFSRPSSLLQMSFFDVCFIGWSPLAELCFDIIANSTTSSVSIVCGPRQMDSGDVARIRRQYEDKFATHLARALHIEITCDISDRLLGIDTSNYVGLSFDSPIIFKSCHIEHFRGRLINEHGAPLPDGRGGGGFSWRIMENDRRGSLIFHLVDVGIDTGEIIYRRDFDFPESCRYPCHYEEHQLSEYRKHIHDVFPTVLSHHFWSQRSSESQLSRVSTYFPRLYTPVNGWISWHWTATEIQRFVLAFSYPYPGAMCLLNNSSTVVRIFDLDVSQELAPHHPFKNGLIFHIDKQRRYWLCLGDSTIVISQDHLKSERKLRVGDRLVTPPDKLFDSIAERPSFDPNGYVPPS